MMNVVATRLLDMLFQTEAMTPNNISDPHLAYLINVLKHFWIRKPFFRMSNHPYFIVLLFPLK